MRTTCNNCGAHLENRGAGHLVCPYCNAQFFDTTIGSIEANQVISSSMALLARKAAREELSIIEPELEKVVAALTLSEQVIASLSSDVYSNSMRRVTPWRIWGFLIGIGSFGPWWVLLGIMFLTSSNSSEWTKSFVFIGALIAAFLTGRFYRRSTTQKRQKAVSTADLRLQSAMEICQQDKHQLELQQKELLAQIEEFRSIAEGRVNQQKTTSRQ